jgi:hypothetical protein
MAEATFRAVVAASTTERWQEIGVGGRSKDKEEGGRRRWKEKVAMDSLSDVLAASRDLRW